MAKTAVVVKDIVANQMESVINETVAQGYELIDIQPSEKRMDQGDAGVTHAYVTTWLVIFGSTSGEY